MAGKARDDAHRAHPHFGLPVVELDYGFSKAAEDAEPTPVLVGVAKDFSYGMVTVVTSKGRGDRYAMATVVRFLREVGHSGRIVLRTDHEPSIQALGQESLLHGAWLRLSSR